MFQRYKIYSINRFSLCDHPCIPKLDKIKIEAQKKPILLIETI